MSFSNKTPFDFNRMSRIDESKTTLDDTNQNVPFNILVVDDESMISALVKEILSKAFNCVVDCVDNTKDAYDLYLKNYYTIMIVDIRIEGEFSGVELLKMITKEDPIVNVIMMTAYATVDLAVECMKLGAWDFITKPFTSDYMELVVKRARENLHLKRLAQERDYFLQLSRMDGLTEIYNRRLFDLVLNSEFSRARRYESSFSLLLIDLDNFKYINDNLGHQMGDEVLFKVARCMKEVSRTSDYLFRFGGDEFAVILPETVEKGARIYAERLLEKIAAIELNRTNITSSGQKNMSRVTASIGLACFKRGFKHQDELLQLCDQALLDAKKTTKNCVVVR